MVRGRRREASVRPVEHPAVEAGVPALVRDVLVADCRAASRRAPSPSCLGKSPFGRSGAEAALGTRGFGRGDRNVAEAVAGRTQTPRRKAIVTADDDRHLNAGTRRETRTAGRRLLQQRNVVAAGGRFSGEAAAFARRPRSVEVRPRERSALARIQLAPAPPCAEKQGPRTDRWRRLAASDAASRAIGEMQVRALRRRRTCFDIDRGLRMGPVALLRSSRSRSLGGSACTR